MLEELTAEGPEHAARPRVPAPRAAMVSSRRRLMELRSDTVMLSLWIESNVETEWMETRAGRETGSVTGPADAGHLTAPWVSPATR
ncbi:hypothetical protein TPCV302_02550 [Cutibacterium avidum]|nr:hypothetical protein TPCV302_02550 [Cutibacterium avidum]